MWHLTNIYLHPGIHEYAEKLTAKLPENLSVSNKIIIKDQVRVYLIKLTIFCCNDNTKKKYCMFDSEGIFLFYRWCISLTVEEKLMN